MRIGVPGVRIAYGRENPATALPPPSPRQYTEKSSPFQSSPCSWVLSAV
jgi:hypothetical protein